MDKLSYLLHVNIYISKSGTQLSLSHLIYSILSSETSTMDRARYNFKLAQAYLSLTNNLCGCVLIGMHNNAVINAKTIWME